MSLPTISPLRGLVEVTRLLRAREDLPALLDAVARTIGESLGYRTVAVNLYRPEWDDFEVTTVYGNEEARATLLGNARPGDDWSLLLSDRFERRGAYDVPSGSVDWNSLGPSYVPQGERACHPDAWDPEDALFVPMRDQRGLLLGIISVDEPVSGRRATDEDLDVLVSLTDHAALAVEAAREAAESDRHQRALEALLAVSSQITGETSNSEILRRVCTGIRDALESRLRRQRFPTPNQREPAVADLLAVDREYRERSADGELPTVAPRRFNPEQEPWLPLFELKRGDWYYRALFSNPALAHRLRQFRHERGLIGFEIVAFEEIPAPRQKNSLTV